MSSKSDPSSLKLDAPFMKELAAFTLEDPEEITETTLKAAKVIIDDGKTNRRDADTTKSLLAILFVVSDLRKMVRRLLRALAVIALFALALWALEKGGVIQFTFIHH